MGVAPEDPIGEVPLGVGRVGAASVLLPHGVAARRGQGELGGGDGRGGQDDEGEGEGSHGVGGSLFRGVVCILHVDAGGSSPVARQGRGRGGEEPDGSRLTGRHPVHRSPRLRPSGA